MNGWSELDDFLRTDPQDVGCAKAMELLHVHVDLVAADASAAVRHPGIAAHLRACGPCGEDFAGLLAAVTGSADLSRGRSRWSLVFLHSRKAHCLRKELRRR